MAQENPIKIEDREELIYMLSEASSLEHMIMCQYLFAAFSLKQDVSEGVTATQLEAIKRWERAISLVATQEMLHLTLVSNLLSAIGSIPFFGRPNFPQKAKYFPPGVQMALLPFGSSTLQHFLYLERPEGMEQQDAPEFQVLAIPKPDLPLTDELVPQTQDFATVGHLYRGIEQGFRHLVEKYGEKQVFIGPPRAQATQEYFSWPELLPVTDLASAVQAIETIVEQGEGSRGDWRHSHYGKFLDIAQEHADLKQQDPQFEPARSTVAAFVRPPSDPADFVLITEPHTAAVSELFNACYEVLLQTLLRYFIHGTETGEEQKLLSDIAVNMMFEAIKPLGTLLTTVPIAIQPSAQTAGPSFEMYRAGYILPHHYSAWIILHERFLELAAYSNKLCQGEAVSPTLQSVAASLHTFATQLGAHIAAN